MEESSSLSMNYKSSYLFSRYNDETVIKMIILFPKRDPGGGRREAHRLQISSKQTVQIPSAFKTGLFSFIFFFFVNSMCCFLDRLGCNRGAWTLSSHRPCVPSLVLPEKHGKQQQNWLVSPHLAHSSIL